MGAAPGSRTASVRASGLSSLAAAARSAGGIERQQALPVPTVVVVVRDGGGETESSRPPLDAVGGAAEIALQQAPHPGELVGWDLVAPEPQRLVDRTLGRRLDPLRRGRQDQLEQRGAARPEGQPVHGGDDLPVVGELAGEACVAAAGQQRRDQIERGGVLRARRQDPESERHLRLEPRRRRHQRARRRWGESRGDRVHRSTPAGNGRERACHGLAGAVRVDVSHHDDRHVRAQIRLGEMGRQRFAGERRHRLRIAKQRTTVGVARKGPGAQQPTRRAGRIDRLAGDLGDRQLLRPGELGRLEGRRGQGVPQDVEPEVEKRRGQRRLVNRLVEPGPGADRPADGLDLALARPRGAPARAPKNEMLVEVRGARQRRGVVGRPRGDPDLQGDDRRGVVLLDDDAHAVVEPRLGARPRTAHHHGGRGRGHRPFGDGSVGGRLTGIPGAPERAATPERNHQEQRREGERRVSERHGFHERLRGYHQYRACKAACPVPCHGCSLWDG